MAKRTRDKETIERDVLSCLGKHGTTTNKQISEELHINPGQITIALRSLKPYTKTVVSDDGSHPCTLVWDIPLLPKIISAFDRDFKSQHMLLGLTAHHDWIPKLIERFDDLQPPFLIASRPSRYLFSWDNVPGKDEKRLMEYFKVDLDIDQAETVEIHKSDDGKTIHIRNGEKSAKIVIDEGTEKATIKINNKRFCDLNVKKENGKPVWRIHKSCKLSISQFQTLSRDENKTQDIRGGQEDHFADSDRYFAVLYNRYINPTKKLIVNKTFRERIIAHEKSKSTKFVRAKNAHI